MEINKELFKDHDEQVAELEKQSDDHDKEVQKEIEEKEDQVEDINDAKADQVEKSKEVSKKEFDKMQERKDVKQFTEKLELNEAEDDYESSKAGILESLRDYLLTELEESEFMDNLAWRAEHDVPGYNHDWCAEEASHDYKEKEYEFIDALADDLMAMCPLEESLKEDLMSSSWGSDFRSDVYNALADIAFKYYKKNINITEDDWNDAIEWFMTHFFESDDNPFDESLKESRHIEYIEKDLADKSGNKKIEDAYQENELTIIKDGNIWYCEHCPEEIYGLVKKEMKKQFPELKWLYENNESLKENKLNESNEEDLRKDAQSLSDYLSKNKLYCDLEDYELYPMGVKVVTFRVEGDWKHDHWYFEDLVRDWAKENGKEIFKMDEHTVEEDGSDYYTADHKVYITDKETSDRLNSMRGLFAPKEESLKESKKLNERISAQSSVLAFIKDAFDIDESDIKNALRDQFGCKQSFINSGNSNMLITAYTDKKNAAKLRGFALSRGADVKLQLSHNADQKNAALNEDLYEVTINFPMAHVALYAMSVCEESGLDFRDIQKTYDALVRFFYDLKTPVMDMDESLKESTGINYGYGISETEKIITQIFNEFGWTLIDIEFWPNGPSAVGTRPEGKIKPKEKKEIRTKYLDRFNELYHGDYLTSCTYIVTYNFNDKFCIPIKFRIDDSKSEKDESLKEDTAARHDLDILKPYLPSDFQYRQFYSVILVRKDIGTFMEALRKDGWKLISYPTATELETENNVFVGSAIFSKDNLNIYVWETESPKVCCVRLLDKSLDESKLDEAIPREVAQALKNSNNQEIKNSGGSKYKIPGMPQYRTSDIDKKDALNKSNVDYEKAEFNKISKEEALNIYKTEPQNLLLIVSDDQGYGNIEQKAIWFEANGDRFGRAENVPDEKAPRRRDGSLISDTKYMTIKQLIDCADSCYWTNQRDVTRDPVLQDIRSKNPESRNYTGLDAMGIEREYSPKNRGRSYLYNKDSRGVDSNSDWHGWSSYQQRRYDNLKAHIEELEAELASGNLDRSEKINKLKRLQGLKSELSQLENTRVKAIGAEKDYNARRRYLTAEQAQRSTMKKFIDLKNAVENADRDLTNAQRNLDDVRKQGGTWSNDYDRRKVSNYTDQIRRLQAQIADYQRMIDELNTKLSSQQVSEEDAKAIADAEANFAEVQNRVQSQKDELNSILDRARARHQNTESLEEAEGKQEPGFEYIVYDYTDEDDGNCPIVAKRSTKTEAEFLAAKWMGNMYGAKPRKKFEDRLLTFEKVPKGKFKVGDNFYGPFDPDWNKTESLEEDLKVTINFDSFEPYGQAVDTYNRIKDANKLDEADSILEELYPDGIDEDSLNDILAYSPEWLLNELGLADDEEKAMLDVE